LFAAALCQAQEPQAQAAARPDRAAARVSGQVRQVQIDLQFVAFDLTNIAHLAAGGINVASLTALWTNGGGEVLAAPTVVTKSGQEAVVKGVTEVIYPTSFDACERQESSSNGLAIVTGAVVTPCGFQTRETGCLLQVVPEVGQDGMINLTLNPQVVEDPIWEDFSQTVPDASGKEHRIQMRQPFFHVLSTSTSVSVYSGKRMLLGGGMPMTDQKRVVYVFVTATLVDPEGQPIKTEAAQ